MADIVRYWLMETSLAFLDLPSLIPLTLAISPSTLARFMSGSAEMNSLRTDGRPTLLENQSLMSP